MSNWDLMMPGMGLTSIGLAGVVISYSGIAHTFIDGMHALTGLTMFIGLIFLAAGILDGGVSTSNRAKATVLVILSISLAFGTAALIFNTVSSVPLFAGIMMVIAIPSIIIAYMSTKTPAYARPMAIIFVLSAITGIGSFTAFGLIGPSPYLVEEPIKVETIPAIPQGPIFAISILADSAEQGNPDYEPDAAIVPFGDIIKWTNDDTVAHTVTSTKDVGELFDSGLLLENEEFLLDSTTLESGIYDYLCIVHPWMSASITVE
ncbi:MAG: blue (type1) copper domain-containing protein [Cenarchaeum symbiont of Oopsacas minuta]|nr:blue (type1) copper domain-containing protein [Cenarchaeum symbiont of Oopsacas minuta]